MIEDLLKVKTSIETKVSDDIGFDVTKEEILYVNGTKNTTAFSAYDSSDYVENIGICDINGENDYKAIVLDLRHLNDYGLKNVPMFVGGQNIIPYHINIYGDYDKINKSYVCKVICDPDDIVVLYAHPKRLNINDEPTLSSALDVIYSKGEAKPGEIAFVNKFDFQTSKQTAYISDFNAIDTFKNINPAERVAKSWSKSPSPYAVAFISSTPKYRGMVYTPYQTDFLIPTESVKGKTIVLDSTTNTGENGPHCYVDFTFKRLDQVKAYYKDADDNNIYIANNSSTAPDPSTENISGYGTLELTGGPITIYDLKVGSTIGLKVKNSEFAKNYKYNVGTIKKDASSDASSFSELDVSIVVPDTSLEYMDGDDPSYTMAGYNFNTSAYFYRSENFYYKSAYRETYADNSYNKDFIYVRNGGVVGIEVTDETCSVEVVSETTTTSNTYHRQNMYLVKRGELYCKNEPYKYDSSDMTTPSDEGYLYTTPCFDPAYKMVTNEHIIYFPHDASNHNLMQGSQDTSYGHPIKMFVNQKIYIQDDSDSSKGTIPNINISVINERSNFNYARSAYGDSSLTIEFHNQLSFNIDSSDAPDEKIIGTTLRYNTWYKLVENEHINGFVSDDSSLYGLVKVE